MMRSGQSTMERIVRGGVAGNLSGAAQRRHRVRFADAGRQSAKHGAPMKAAAPRARAFPSRGAR